MVDWDNQKLILLGDDEVSKNGFRNLLGRGFRREHLTSIGADFAICEKIIDGEKITFQIWDLVGQDSLKSARTRFIRGAMGGICIYDVTNKDSFMNITRWIEELWRNGGRGIVPIILLADILNSKQERYITNEQGNSYAEALTKKTQEYGFEVHSMDISTSTGYNVDLALETISKEIIELIKKGNFKLKY